MTSRNEILSRLKKNPVELPHPVRRVREYPDLTAHFADRLTAAKGEVLRAAGLDQAVEVLRGIFDELQIRSVAAHREAPFDGLDLPETFSEQRWFFAGEQGDYREQCALSDAGLTSAAYALAETGSLVLESGPGHSRLASLLPPIHVVFLPESRIIPSIFDWVRLRPDPLPSNVILISGPSKTADIEQTLVVGVHGPKRLIVIVYPDSE